MTEKINNIPVLPLRDMVLFPSMVTPLYVGRPKSMKAVQKVTGGRSATNELFITSQISSETDNPMPEDLHKVGTLARVVQTLKLPDGTMKVLVEGIRRAEATSFTETGTMMVADVHVLPEEKMSAEEFEPLRRAIAEDFKNYQEINKRIPQDQADRISKIVNPEDLLNSIAQLLQVGPEKKQSLLDLPTIQERLERVLGLLEGEIDIQQTEKRIRARVKSAMEKSQRDYYLNEQVKAIQKELGEPDDARDFSALETRIKEAGMSEEAELKAMDELKKLKQMNPQSAEATVVSGYLDVLLDLPWKNKSRINKDIKKAEQILENDHYGLEQVKERILEYLAVQSRVKHVKSPILCLVGAPGVGKTSLGQSIARATGRKFVRMALGGVRDESEIRGHRRTYIGSMPGRILQNLTKCGVKNPLFLLDEVDKMGMDYRGDPAAALLEVLDPEQNNTFEDHYVEVDFDLSDVMFVATSNSMNIPAPLLDRMEIINLSGYTEDEKVNIAERHLIPKQLKLNGLKDKEIEIDRSAVVDIIRYYTREAGVRGLERQINKICRKVVKEILLTKKDTKAVVNSENLAKYLGVKKFMFGVANKENQVGQVTGLAWTEVGGDLLSIEVATMAGKGNIIRTGSLGEVMKESVEAARSVVRSRAASLGIANKTFAETDIHVHFPEGATPKDGPSAGGAITTALVSALTGIPVRADIAMTGEITLRGEILPIGGLKEKLLAALRGGIKQVLIPKENERDLVEIPDNVKEGLKIIPVKTIEEVLSLALERKPVPLVPSEEPKEAQNIIVQEKGTEGQHLHN